MMKIAKSVKDIVHIENFTRWLNNIVRMHKDKISVNETIHGTFMHEGVEALRLGYPQSSE